MRVSRAALLRHGDLALLRGLTLVAIKAELEDMLVAGIKQAAPALPAPLGKPLPTVRPPCWSRVWPSLVLCSFAFVVLLELGAALCSCFAVAVLELVWALDGAFLLLRSLGAGVALHDAGRGGNDAEFRADRGVLHHRRRELDACAYFSKIRCQSLCSAFDLS